MMEPKNFTASEWVKAAFNDVASRPPDHAATCKQIAAISGMGRSTAERLLDEKVKAGTLVRKAFLENKHWIYYYWPAENGKAKKAPKDRRP